MVVSIFDGGEDLSVYLSTKMCHANRDIGLSMSLIVMILKKMVPAVCYVESAKIRF